YLGDIYRLSLSIMTFQTSVCVQRFSGTNESAEEIRDRLTRAIQTHLLKPGSNVIPLLLLILGKNPSC
ncbi:MAG: hypothetical protein ACM37W_09315, partial [Actinomycetota bacterium]